MKNLLIIILLCVAYSSFSQIAGSKIDGPFTAKDGTVFKEGDKFQLGLGTLLNGSYKYIYQPQNVLAGTSGGYLGSGASNMSLEIKYFKLVKNKKLGDKTIAVVNPGGFNYAVDIDAAIQSGEIITENSAKPKQAASTTSKADELKKLKELLDSGALTQEEYDAEKKKVLNAN